MENQIYILGIGPGSEDYLLPITRRLAEESDVLIGGKRAIKLFSDLDKEELVIKADLKRVLNYIKDNYCQKQIAVLVSGDPGLYSMLNYLSKHFSKDKLKVIPGISSLQLGFAKAKLVWQDAEITSLHGRDKAELLEMIEDSEKVGFFTDYKFPPDQIAEYLLEAGVTERRAFVGERLSYGDERVIDGKLEEITKYNDFGMSVMVIYSEGDLA
ncbi:MULTISPECIES: precorrin-6y C5,15-methyltransferase (decarboxylating) subunit CbiE [unclassified Candidatus Frackibacter]|uniref:precorrin-6y C5,15-methyltransferase (decarboxylating) subunit CbiE n=1 Tax=unclassified Candidatus Frackibacter TaxID=2648818 RepID=UPI000798053B|nr:MULTISPECIES: precorrin-6y C5,15-methyltransferase (decarboxylating) subunit CbiE [unclassified Candidatus Frackibacter]KXS43889.1 MAG: precorrin-6Y C5,15-methyltransferase [Candidatus Frackibacter sp. T328-2]SDC33958.1 precorrin-6Y C5,15-methyltransferase (decarboxylating) [Candidatus Frackibacter sp. WG11]SEM57232.1 precorrin-6Y C5,15-methyltransferase (decarboxylating) [Candidatus Frackibacter sp. WG12]SFL70040.1 precorrin-6Y C5,15-methyltransferase (decarboxylating) [Candidatus Frackibac